LGIFEKFGGFDTKNKKAHSPWAVGFLLLKDENFV
jgi:hypothetical protein